MAVCIYPSQTKFATNRVQADVILTWLCSYHTLMLLLLRRATDLWTSGRAAGRVAIQEVSKGRQPSRLGCMYTMPHLLTVAGDATARSATSKIMFMRPDMAMISPLFRHSFLLSSST